MVIFRVFWTDLSTLFLPTSEKIRGQSVGKMRFFFEFPNTVLDFNSLYYNTLIASNGQTSWQQ